MRASVLRLAEIFCAAVCAFAAVALALRLTVADSYPATALLFHATPLPLLCALALAATIVSLVIGKRGLATLLFLLAVIAALFWRQSFPPSRAEAPLATRAEPTLRLMAWNNRRSADVAASAAFIRGLDPDLAAIIELAGYSEREAEAWQSALDPMRVRAMRGAMLLASSQRIGRPQFFQFGSRSRINVTGMRLGERQVNIIAVDLDATPWRWREPDFVAFGHILDSYAGRPTIIIGDFNTPLDSVAFRQLSSRGFIHAFRAAGRGPAETWPWPLPILALDHIFVSPEFEVVSSRRVGTPLSDHYAVLADVALRSTSEASASAKAPARRAPVE